MNNKLNQPILISIVTANSDKIFRTLDNFISTVKDETAVKIRIFDNNSLPEYKKRLTEYRNIPTSISIFMMKIPDLVMDIITI